MNKYLLTSIIQVHEHSCSFC